MRLFFRPGQKTSNHRMLLRDPRAGHRNPCFMARSRTMNLRILPNAVRSLTRRYLEATPFLDVLCLFENGVCGYKQRKSKVAKRLGIFSHSLQVFLNETITTLLFLCFVIIVPGRSLCGNCIYIDCMSSTEVTALYPTLSLI